MRDVCDLKHLDGAKDCLYDLTADLKVGELVVFHVTCQLKDVRLNPRLIKLKELLQGIELEILARRKIFHGLLVLYLLIVRFSASLIYASLVKVPRVFD